MILLENEAKHLEHMAIVYFAPDISGVVLAELTTMIREQLAFIKTNKPTPEQLTQMIGDVQTYLNSTPVGPSTEGITNFLTVVKTSFERVLHYAKLGAVQ